MLEKGIKIRPLNMLAKRMEIRSPDMLEKGERNGLQTCKRRE
jgi:hypothetical protein